MQDKHTLLARSIVSTAYDGTHEIQGTVICVRSFILMFQNQADLTKAVNGVLVQMLPLSHCWMDGTGTHIIAMTKLWRLFYGYVTNILA